MGKDTFIMTVAPRHLRQLQGWGVIPAHLSYRIGRGPHLFRAGESAPGRGGLMVLEDCGFDGMGGGIAPFCQEVLRECGARSFGGAVLDFQGRLPPLERVVCELDERFAQRGWTLYVPESYGHCAPQAKVMIPSALSGGSLAVRLEEAGEQFGHHRVVLALKKVAEDFFLPSPTGSGVSLSHEALRQRIEELSPSIFFSHELCARYFTYMSRSTGAHFVLFDDADTLRRKLEVARQKGIHTFIAAWEDISEDLPDLGCLRLSQGRRGF